MATALLVIGVVAIGLMRIHQRDMVAHAVQRTRSRIANLYRRSVDDHITMLGATAVALTQDDAWADALARRDRQVLEQHAAAAATTPASFRRSPALFSHR